MSKLSRLARHFDDLAGQTVKTAYLYLSASPDESIKLLASLDSLDTSIKTFKEIKMTLNEFTRAFNMSFALREKNGRYECSHSDDTFAFSITLREEELSFGEAMGYCPEKERPVVDPVDAIYDACYCDGDSLDAIFMYGGSFTGATDTEQLRNLLDSAFSRDEEQSEDLS